MVRIDRDVAVQRVVGRPAEGVARPSKRDTPAVLRARPVRRVLLPPHP